MTAAVREGSLWVGGLDIPQFGRTSKLTRGPIVNLRISCRGRFRPLISTKVANMSTEAL